MLKTARVTASCMIFAEPGELAVAQSIRGHGEAILDQCYAPRDHDRFPDWPPFAVLQMAVPREGHEDVRGKQQE
jgi:hypothetical protein